MSAPIRDCLIQWLDTTAVVQELDMFIRWHWWKGNWEKKCWAVHLALECFSADTCWHIVSQKWQPIRFARGIHDILVDCCIQFFFSIGRQHAATFDDCEEHLDSIESFIRARLRKSRKDDMYTYIVSQTREKEHVNSSWRKRSPFKCFVGVLIWSLCSRCWEYSCIFLYPNFRNLF